jgi:hypothetical protein
MAVMSLFKNLDRPLPVRDQLDGLARDLLAESAETSALPATRRMMSPVLQRLEAGQ